MGYLLRELIELTNLCEMPWRGAGAWEVLYKWWLPLVLSLGKQVNWTSFGKGRRFHKLPGWKKCESSLSAQLVFDVYLYHYFPLSLNFSPSSTPFMTVKSSLGKTHVFLTFRFPEPSMVPDTMHALQKRFSCFGSCLSEMTLQYTTGLSTEKWR